MCDSMVLKNIMVAPDNLMETPMERNAAKGTTDDISSSQSNRNEPSTDVKEASTEVHNKQPSYVALACCISGYTTLSYDSKQRQSLRSRPVSPIRPESLQNVMYTSECGKYLLPEPAKVTEKMPTEGKGIDVMNGCGGLHSPRHVASISLSQESRSYSSSAVSESYTYNSSRFSRTTTTSSFTTINGGDSSSSRLITPTKLTDQLSPSSFIVQRVERLYGPGALAQGFYSPRKTTNTTTIIKSVNKEDLTPTSTVSGKNEDSLPVLKLLRPEFRAQLNVANRKLRTISIPEKLSSGTFEEKLKIEDTYKSPTDQVDATINNVNNKSMKPLIEIKDGNYFLKILRENVDILEKLAEEAENGLVDCNSEEGCGILRAAAGKARLLVAQKLKQFEGLCHKNIKQSENEDFPTTNEDLAGFWDMVLIQVNEVLAQFEQINELKKNDWKNIESITSEANINRTPTSQTTSKTSTSRKVTSRKSGEPKSGGSSSASKARDEARRKMIEERRKAMKESKKCQDNDDTVFVL